MPERTSSIKDLLENLRVKDAVARADARQDLVRIGAPAVAALVELLHSPEPHVRWEAAKTLKGIADASAAPALVEALADPDRDVCWVAAEALVAIGPRGLKPLVGRLSSKPLPDQPHPDFLYQGAHHVLSQFAKQSGDRRYDRLLAALGQEDPELSVPQAAEEFPGGVAP